MEWKQDAKDLLEELLKPIPVFVRPMARKGIEKNIIGLAENKEEVTVDDVARGYVAASSGDMREKAIKVLKAKGFDPSIFQENK